VDISPGELIGSEIYIETDKDEDELSEDDLFDEEPVREILPDSEKQLDAGSGIQEALDDELQSKKKKNTAEIIPIRRGTRFLMRSYR